MAAGVFGYLGYDMVRLMEELPPANPDPIGIPDAILMRPTIVVVFDAVQDTITVVTPVRPESGVSAPRPRYARAAERLTAIVDALDRAARASRRRRRDRPARRSGPPPTPRRRSTSAWCAPPRSTSRAGDIFQVVLSQRFEAPFELPPFALYRALRRTNPSPFLYFLDFGGFAVAGSSPEILVRRARTARSPSARSPAPGRAAPRRTRTRRWRTSCSPTRRSAPST